VVVVVDASYFGKRREATDLDGIMVFVDSLTGEVIWAKFIKNETNSDYQEGLDYIESRGFEILGAVSDGRKGLARIFKDYPYQICQFHIQKGISTILTKNPKSEAGKDLKCFNDTFIKLRLTKEQFTGEIEIYLKTYQEYLSEMSEIEPTRYKHEKLRKALNKYRNNLKYMFTYQTTTEADPQLQNQLQPTQIPNTTNHIDGGIFSPLKRLLNNHPGTTKQRRRTWIILFLNSRGKSIT
jgi:hypothetical protein